MSRFSLATLTLSILFSSLIAGAGSFSQSAYAVGGTVTIIKETIPDGAEGSFDFTGEGFGEGSELESFSLGDGGSASDTSVDDGSYEVTEDGQEGWDLTSISCDSEGEGEGEGEGSTAFISLEGASTVTCTFTNTQRAHVTIEKQTVDDVEGLFEFSGSLDGGEGEGEGVELSNGESVDFFVVPGEYGYSESVGEDWDLTDIDCGVAEDEDDAEPEGDGVFFDLEAGDDVACTFTNRGLYDFGDAPDDDDDDGTYPTLFSHDGARHLVNDDDDDDDDDGSLRLGESVDEEFDGQPNGEASGDDDNDEDDEDGVEFASDLVPGEPADIEIDASAEGKLDAWVDFNDDGDWDDESEQIFHSKLLESGENGLSFDVPPEAETGTTYARFRFSTAGCLEPTGFTEDGEVEDYLVSIDDEGEGGEGEGGLDEGESEECQEDEVAEGGGHQGSRYRRQNLVRFLMGLGNVGFGDTGLPGSSFGGPGPGGGTGELTQEQLEALCAVRDHITLLAMFDVGDFIAENYAHIYDVPEEVVADVLQNGTGCEAVNAAKAEEARLLAKAEAKAAADRLAAELAAIEARKPVPIVFNVGEDGYPVASDPVWNACIRNVQLFVEGQLKPVNCNRYHEGHTWKHPDMLISFNWSDNVMKRIRVRGETVATNVVASPQYLVTKHEIKNHLISKLTIPSLMYFVDRALDITNFSKLLVTDDTNTTVLSEQEVDSVD